jgi:hypothetical protein
MKNKLVTALLLVCVLLVLGAQIASAAGSSIGMVCGNITSKHKHSYAYGVWTVGHVVFMDDSMLYWTCNVSPSDYTSAKVGGIICCYHPVRGKQ